MSALSEVLLDADRRPAVVAALADVVDAEVKEKKGVSGMAVKAAYGAARTVSSSFVPQAVNKLLPDFAAALDPFWAEFTASGGVGSGGFGAFLAARSPQVSAALLAVTDAKVAGSSREMVKKAYRGVRGKAEEHISAALPRVGTTVERFAAASSQG